jgi:acetyltransferase-like isoleucine patch superfamily enzyme
MLYLFKNYLLTRAMRHRFPTARIDAPIRVHRESLEKNLITLGKGVEILSGAIMVGNIVIGDYSYTSFNVELYASELHAVRMGKFCSIATGVCIISSHHHDPTTLANYPIKERILAHSTEPSGSEIVIGNDVWIGARAVILPGVTIGDGAIVGAGSTVTGGTVIKPYEVWAGNPAKKIKDRFPKEALERMKMMTWWEWDIDEIKKNKEMFVKPVV